MCINRNNIDLHINVSTDAGIDGQSQSLLLRCQTDHPLQICMKPKFLNPNVKDIIPEHITK